VSLKSKIPPRFQKYASCGIILKLFLAPVALIIFILIILVRPVLKIYIYKVDWPFGHFFVMPHFASHSHQLWNLTHRRKKIGIYCLETKSVSNQFAYRKFKQTIPIFKGNLGWILIWVSKRIRVVSGKSSIIDFNGRSLKTSPSDLLKRDSLITFADSETRMCSEFLRVTGVNADKGFICLNIRDDLYNQSVSLIKKSYDARNSEARTYVAAAETLAEMGYTVFRMGAIVKEPLVSTHSRVIDYATNGMRTKLLDIFLGAHCTFTISTGSGWDSVPTIFRRPIMFVNQLPVFAPSAITLPIVAYPKILLDNQTGSILSLKNLIDREIAHRAN